MYRALLHTSFIIEAIVRLVTHLLFKLCHYGDRSFLSRNVQSPLLARKKAYHRLWHYPMRKFELLGEDAIAA